MEKRIKVPLPVTLQERKGMFATLDKKPIPEPIRKEVKDETPYQRLEKVMKNGFLGC